MSNRTESKEDLMRGSHRWLWLVVGCITAIVVFYAYQSYSGKKSATTPTKSTTLYLGWIFAGSYAGDALAQTTFANQHGLNLTIKEGGIGLDPIKLVRDGTFGIASSDDLLKAIDKGANLVMIGLATEDSPAAFVALKRISLNSPADFKGKRIGVLPFGSTTLVYRSMLKANGIDRSMLKEVTVSPDLKAFITADTHDVQPIYDYDESVTLDKEGVAYTSIRPKDWGVKFKGAAYFTTASTVEKQPELVQKFVQATVDGWQAAARSPSDAIQALQSLSPKLDATRELAVLMRGLPYFVTPTRRPLTTDPASWSQMTTDLLAFGELSKPANLEKALNLSFVANAYANRK